MPSDGRLAVCTILRDSEQGSGFTIANLLGPAFADVARFFNGGALMISRLAPQDYHRFHIAVSGRINRRAEIDGALYTVNPVAVRQHINVFTENKRVVRREEWPA